MLFYSFNIRCYLQQIATLHFVPVIARYVAISSRMHNYHQQIAMLHFVPVIARYVAITMTIMIGTVIARHEAISSRMQLPSTDCHASLLFALNDGHDEDSVIARYVAITMTVTRIPSLRGTKQSHLECTVTINRLPRFVALRSQ